MLDLALERMSEDLVDLVSTIWPITNKAPALIVGLISLRDLIGRMCNIAISLLVTVWVAQ